MLAIILGISAAYLLERAGYHVVAILTTALTGLLVSPISWDHHWVWITLAVAVAVDYAISAARSGAKGTARWLWLAIAGMIFTYAAWPDALFTQARNLGKFSLGLLWLQENTQPAVFALHGDSSSYPEYHWHGFQLIWGNAYILGGMALLLFLLAIAFRVHRQGPLVPANDPAPAPAQPCEPSAHLGRLERAQMRIWLARGAPAAQRVGWLRLLDADSSEAVDCVAEEFGELTPD